MKNAKTWDEIEAEIEAEDERQREHEERTYPEWARKVEESAAKLDEALSASSEQTAHCGYGYWVGGYAHLECVWRTADGIIHGEVHVPGERDLDETFTSETAKGLCEIICTQFNSYRENPPAEWFSID